MDCFWGWKPACLVVWADRLRFDGILQDFAMVVINYNGMVAFSKFIEMINIVGNFASSLIRPDKS